MGGEQSQQWREQILEGLTTIPRLKMTPGYLLVFGQKANAILTGTDESDILIAASELGNGRVIGLAHQGFLKERKKDNRINQFINNIFKWLAKGNYNENNDIDSIENFFANRSFNPKILIDTVEQKIDYTQEQYARLIKYIQNGGSYLHAMCPWGWLQLNPNKKINNIPGHQLLQKVGMYYSSGYSKIGQVYQIKENKADKSNVNKAIGSFIEKNQTLSSDQNWREQILEGLITIPRLGMIPGFLVVFGQKANAILTGTDESDILIAASELGNGRVIGLAHQGFLKERKKDNRINQFINNIFKWLAKGNYNENNDIDSIENFFANRSFNPKILIDTVEQKIDYTQEQYARLIKYIQNGGSYLHAMCPWGWLQLNPNKKINNIPGHQLLQKVGMYYSSGYSKIGQVYQIKENKADKSNVNREKNQVLSPQLSSVFNELQTSMKADLNKKPLNYTFNQASSQNKPILQNQNWREQILEGLTTIPRLKMTPGYLLVFGQKANAILTGKNESDILIAASELGNGRVIGLAHSGFLKERKKDNRINQFINNIFKWLAKGNYNENNDIDSIEKFFANNNFNPKVLIDTVEQKIDYTQEQYARLIKYIQNGGSYLHAMCPWGWLQLNPNKKINNIPGHQLLQKVGMYYSSGYSKIGQVYQIKENKAAKSNINKAIRSFIEKDQVLSPQLPSVINELPYSIKQELKTKFSNSFTITEIPSQNKPISQPRAKFLISLWQTFYCSGDQNTLPAPGYQKFPGSFNNNSPKLYNPELSFTSKPLILDYYCTGFYAIAGKPIKVEILGQLPKKFWKIHIGLHKDNLSGCSSLKRWPNISVQQTTHKQIITICSSFGGLVYLQSPYDNGISKIKVRLFNVVEAPYFNLNDPNSIQNWKQRRNSQGLWSDIQGELIVFTVPSSSVRKLQDPSKVMELWDKVVEAHHELRGTDPRKQRKQWIICDMQPVLGYMHSGYPIVTHLDVSNPENENFLFSSEVLLKKGNWGVYHEIGHNMQRGQWTYDGTVEVTCNLFTLHAMQLISSKKPWIHQWLKGALPQTKQYLKKPNFEVWKDDPGIALFIYAQIIKYFGWNVLKKVFRDYEKSMNNLSLDSEQKKIDEWWTRVSLQCNRNLEYFLKIWGIPYSNNFTQKVKHLENFIPNDQVVQKK